MQAPGADVVDAARRGDPAALEQLWRWLSPSVVGYLKGRGVPDAEDTASEVFLAVFGRIKRFSGDAAAFRTFVFSVAHARCVDHYRRERRRRTEEYEEWRDRRTTRSAEHEAIDRLAERRAHDLLAVLSPDQREVMTLRVIAELSLEETANVLGKPVGAVKSLQHRALAALRRSLDPAVSP